MEFKRVFGWYSDDMPETTEAVVYVSRCGTVVKCGSYKHWNKINNNYSLRKEKIYQLSTNRGKASNPVYGRYLHVYIRDRYYQVHRLVAMAWIPNPENKPQVNHINGMKWDNRAENLEWVTNLENRQHAGRHLIRNTLVGENVATSRLTDEAVRDIRTKLKSPYKGICRDLAAKYGVCASTITWIRKGRTWKNV